MKNGKGELVCDIFYDGDSPILLGERELLWPKITTNLFLDLYSWSMVTSLPPCVYYNFFFQDRCIRAVGSGGKWAVCKAFGNVRQFFNFFYLLDGMGLYYCREACVHENQKRGRWREFFFLRVRHVGEKRVQVLHDLLFMLNVQER